jgi:hypothetical protein
VKHVIDLTIFLAVGSLFIAPNSAGAVEVIETGGYSSTTTTIDNYPSNNSWHDRGNYSRNRHQHRQERVIFQQNKVDAGSNRSNCTTTIIGSPIPSPIPIDRYTGQPCR